jgi:hypothetical protein
MRRTHKALATLTLGLARPLVGATTAAAAATPPHLRRNRGWATYRFGSGSLQPTRSEKEGSLMATARRRAAMIARRPRAAAGTSSH